MTDTYVLVADSAQARLFIWRGNQLSAPLKHWQNQHARDMDRDLSADKPGRSFDSKGGARHSMEEMTSPKHHLADVFAREVANDLNALRKEETLQQLILVAAPAFLGQLRQALDHHTQQCVQHSFDKNLGYHDEAAIEEELKKLLVSLH